MISFMDVIRTIGELIGVVAREVPSPTPEEPAAAPAPPVPPKFDEIDRKIDDELAKRPPPAA